MELIFKVAALAFGGTVLAASMKRQAPEFSLLVAVAASIAALVPVLAILQPVKDFILELAGAASLESAVLSPLFRVLGITILTKLSSDVCLDAGERMISGVVETAGAAAAVYVALPLLSALLGLIGSAA